MCGHKWRQVEDVRVCVLCGMTLTRDGKLVLDRRLAGAVRRGKRRGKQKKTALQDGTVRNAVL